MILFLIALLPVIWAVFMYVNQSQTDAPPLTIQFPKPIWPASTLDAAWRQFESNEARHISPKDVHRRPSRHLCL